MLEKPSDAAINEDIEHLTQRLTGKAKAFEELTVVSAVIVDYPKSTLLEKRAFNKKVLDISAAIKKLRRLSKLQS